MRLIPLILAIILTYLQVPLWFGKGGWLEVKELTRKVAAVDQKNVGLEDRNSVLRSEVEDLRNGKLSVEERARRDMGMLKKEEIFVQMTKTSE